MTTRALVKDAPWSSRKAREGTVELAVVTEAPFGGGRVRVLPEHLVRHDGGARRRTVRLLFDGVEVDGSTTVEARLDGSPAPAEVIDGPPGSVRVLLPLTATAVDAAVTVRAGGVEQTLAWRLEPPREWRIHLVHHSHLDIGYTDPQGVVLGEHVSFLDSCLDLTELTDGWDDDAQFRWAVESLWSFEQWAAARPADRIRRFIDRVREGRVELTAMPFNLHTDTCSTDELHELLRPARRIRDEYGVEFRSAMQTDVPGCVAGLPDALDQLGVRYLSVAHNWAGRSVPQLIGGQHLPRLFRWRSPAGKQVLVWMTDSPHGLAYMEGPVLGFDTSYELVDDLLPAYLTSLATRPYPFPPGMFGWHGPAVEDRQPYPWDLLHLRVQGHFGDNAPPRLILAETVQRWNETWESPRLRLSTNADFFDDAEQRVGDQLETFEGDWGDWWVEGVGSGARQQALVRRAQASLNSSRTVAGMALAAAGDPGPRVGRVQDEAAAVYHCVSLFNEHTWGAANSWTYSDEGMNSGSQQEIWKFANAIHAEDNAAVLADRAAADFAAVFTRAEDAALSLWAVNPSGFARGGVVRGFVRESRIPLEHRLRIVDPRTGADVAFTEIPQTNPDHRDAGRFVEFAVPYGADAAVPAVGALRFDVYDAGVAASDADGEGGDLVWSKAFFGRPSASHIPPAGTAAVLENAHLRVEVDLSTATISSIVEKASGRELVDADAVVGFNGYVYDTYTTAGGYNHQSNKTSVSEELELLGSRTLASPAVLLERTDDGVTQRLSYEWNADGVNRGWTMLTLGVDDAHLVIDNRFDKPATMTKESAYLAFPFASQHPTVRYEITGTLTGDGLDHVPGAPQHMRAVRSFVTVTDVSGTVAWVTRDAPLVQPETIALPYAPFPDSTAPRQPGTVYSWVHNNIWDTNFPAQQAFEATFRYAVGVRRADEDAIDPAALGVRTAAAVDQPLLAVPAVSPGPSAESRFGVLSVDDPAVRLVSLVALPDGGLSVQLQSYRDEAGPVALHLARPFATAEVTTLLDDPTGVSLAVEHDTVTVPLPRLGTVAVRLTPARDGAGRP